METFLFTWNPGNGWREFEKSFELFEEQGFLDGNWSCGNRRALPPGSRFFLIHLGEEPKGIVASGTTVSDPVKGAHWKTKGKKAWYVGLQFEVVVRPDPSQVLPLALLDKKLPFGPNWTPTASGIVIPPQVASKLEMVWSDHLQKIGQQDKNVPDTDLYEGGTYTIRTFGYKRNLEARKRCIEKFGATCHVCEFSFQEKYGALGENYTHVHHLKPISTIAKEYKVVPTEDLRPVCPNCHVMLHTRRNPPLSIEELRAVIQKHAVFQDGKSRRKN